MYVSLFFRFALCLSIQPFLDEPFLRFPGDAGHHQLVIADDEFGGVRTAIAEQPVTHDRHYLRQHYRRLHGRDQQSADLDDVGRPGTLRRTRTGRQPDVLHVEFTQLGAKLRGILLGPPGIATRI